MAKPPKAITFELTSLGLIEQELRVIKLFKEIVEAKDLKSNNPHIKHFEVMDDFLFDRLVILGEKYQDIISK